MTMFCITLQHQPDRDWYAGLSRQLQRPKFDAACVGFIRRSAQQCLPAVPPAVWDSDLDLKIGTIGPQLWESVTNILEKPCSKIVRLAVPLLYL